MRTSSGRKLSTSSAPGPEFSALLIQAPLTSDGAAPIVTRNPGQSDGRSRGFGDSETGLVRGNCEGRVRSPHHKGLTSDDGGQGCPLASSPTPAHSPLPLLPPLPRGPSDPLRVCLPGGWSFLFDNPSVSVCLSLSLS